MADLKREETILGLQRVLRKTLIAIDKTDPGERDGLEEEARVLSSAIGHLEKVQKFKEFIKED